MTTTAKSARITNPAGSHHLSTDYTGGPRTTFSKEELYPVLEIDLPRVGTVTVQFSADRYVASSWDEKTQTSSPVWTEWRIYPRRIEPAHGIGDAARAAIRAAGEPLILEWLASPSYPAARRRAAAYAVKRLFQDAGSRYSLDSLGRQLEEIAPELEPEHLAAFRRALEHKREENALLDAIPGEEA